MRVVGIFKSRGLALSRRSFSRAKAFRTGSEFERLPTRNNTLVPQDWRRYFNMTTSLNGEETWTAVRVRDTFLEYFKKNGHTFGQSGTNES